jgi:4-amino-4-deoxy-L-arabinose transferase-like glycosyltransferase
VVTGRESPIVLRPAPGARPATRTSFWPWAAALFLGLAVLTHLPSFLRPLWSPDEAYLATQAQVLGAGGVLYEDVVDRKPPLLPYLYALAFEVTGSDALWSVRVLAVFAHAATALLLAGVARRRWGYRAALAAGVLYLLGSAGLAPEDSQAANFEVFMLPAVAAAMVLADRGRLGAAGAAAGVAVLTKQVAGVTLLPLAWLAWRAWRAGDRAAPGRLGAGFALPVLLGAWACGWERFLYWVATGSEGYLDARGSWQPAAARLLGTAAIFAAGNLAAVVLAARSWRTRGEDADLWLGLLGAVVAVTAGFRFFGHYYLQLLPPLALLAAGRLARTGRLVRARGLAPAAHWRRRRGGALAVLPVAVFVGLAFAWPDSRVDHAERFAAAIRANSAATDRILVWGMSPELYWASDRRPATRYLTAGFLTNFGGGRTAHRVGEQHVDAALWHEFDLDLAAHPPVLVVDDSRGAPYRPERVPRLAAYLAGYTRVATVDGSVLYRRLPQ